MTTSVKYEVEQLYHYTSLNTLHAILQNKTIRLTDYRFLNDMQELFFLTQIIMFYHYLMLGITLQCGKCMHLKVAA